MLRNENKQAKTKYELYKLTICISTTNIWIFFHKFFTCFSHISLLRLSISAQVSKKIFGIINKWWGVQISIRGIGLEKNSKINKREGTFIWHSRVSCWRFFEMERRNSTLEETTIFCEILANPMNKFMITLEKKFLKKRPQRSCLEKKKQ